MLSYETLLADAMRLPAAQRMELIEALWETLPDELAAPMSEEWLGEVHRRSAEFDEGSVKTIPWEQIRSDARKRVGANRENDAR